MGNTSSSVNVASVLASLRSSEVARAEVLEALLSVSLTTAELQRALPLSTLRELRHCYTGNFAQLLYTCIRHVAAVAALRTQAETQPLLLTHDQLSRLLMALQLLQRLLPVAHEDGNTPLPQSTSMPHGDASTPAPQTQTPSQQQTTTTTSSTPHETTPPTTSVAPTRTRATLHFTRLFFVKGRTCDDAAPDATFPLLPCQLRDNNNNNNNNDNDNEQTVAAAAATPHRSLGASLVWALVECCFIRGLTLPSTPVAVAAADVQASTPPAAGDDNDNNNNDGDHRRSDQADATTTTSRTSLAHPDVYEDLLWYGGVGNVDPFVYRGDSRSSSSSLTSYTPVAPTTSPSAHRARAELLATLLSALSAPLYHRASVTGAAFRDSVFTEAALSTAAVPLAPTLAVSMLNAILRYNPYGAIPYMSHFVSSEEAVVVGSARVLVALLSCRGIEVPQAAVVDADSRRQQQQQHDAVSTTPQPDSNEAATTTTATATTTTATTATTTCWVHSIRKVVSELTLTEAKFIIEQLKTMVTLKAFAETTFLPDSQRRFECYDEFMMLLWHLVALSYAVHLQMCSSPHVLDYLAPLLRYGLEVRYTVGLVNQLQTVLFILLRLSEQRAFAVQCNKPCKVVATYPLPVLPTGSTYHDLLVLSLGLILGTHEPTLRMLLQPCAVIVSNLAPYMTALGPAASTRLVVTFAQFATRTLDAEAAHDGSDNNNSNSSTDDEVVMLYTCEAIASLLQYHESGAHYVLAALVDYRDTVRRVRAAFAPSPLASSDGNNSGASGAAGSRRNSDKSGARAGSMRMALPQLMTTLDLAVSAALPYVESVTSTSAAPAPPPAAAADATSTTASDAAGEAPASTTTTTTSGAASSARVDAPTVVNAAAMEKLRTLTLVGMLPTPHRIVTKLFRVTASTEQWGVVAFWTSMYMYAHNNAFGDAASARMLHFV